MSGKKSDDIFGDNSYDNSDLTFQDKQSNAGAAGIGTEGGVSQKSNEAASSFLDSKKTQAKIDYNFQPNKSTSIQYGAN